MDDFLDAISTTATHVPVKKSKVFETAAEFTEWLKQNPIKSVDQFLTAARVSINVKSEDHKKVFGKMDSIASRFLPPVYGTMSSLEIVHLLRFILQVAPKSQVSSDIQKLFIENVRTADLLAVPFETLVMLVRYSNSSVEKKVLKKIAAVLLLKLEKDLGSASDLFSILAGEGYEVSKWFHNETFVNTTEKLVSVMGIPEKCALLKLMGNHKQRNRQLLGAIINSLSASSQCLSIPQIVNVVSSCTALTYYPPKIARKVADDLSKNSNVLDNWIDVIVIADSFTRMRMGDQQSWKLLIRWAVENAKQAKTDQLSRFVSSLARIGEPSGKPLAKMLKPMLARERSSSPAAWLNTVYSLAYFQELDETHADSVLNKSFVNQIMNSEMVVNDRLRKAMTLLMISSAAKFDMQGKYQGPTVEKETFSAYGINFDAKTIRSARELKYSKNTAECDNVFLKSLFQTAPQDTHCGLPNVEECGAFVDAYVMPDPKTGLLVSVSQWGSSRPIPLFFYGWLQTKQNMEKLSSEDNILGQEQLGLRLMRASGYDPLIVFKSEFDYCSTDIEKVTMMRDKIHKKN